MSSVSKYPFKLDDYKRIEASLREARNVLMHASCECDGFFGKSSFGGKAGTLLGRAQRLVDEARDNLVYAELSFKEGEVYCLNGRDIIIRKTGKGFVVWSEKIESSEEFHISESSSSPSALSWMINDAIK